MKNKVNKVQWQRTETGIELYVFEPNDKGVGAWKLYTNSKYFAPDLKMEGASRGLETFRKCLAAGYTLLDVEGNEVET